LTNFSSSLYSFYTGCYYTAHQMSLNAFTVIKYNQYRGTTATSVTAPMELP